MIHIMLDLETWGTEPGCDIRSIGACVFDPVVGTVWAQEATPLIGEKSPRAPFYIACDNPDGVWMNGDFHHQIVTGKPLNKYFLHRDPRTVQWWSEQSDEAQAAFAEPVDLRDALGKFTDWLIQIEMSNGIYENDKGSSQIRLWSHGPAFDPPILAAAYKAVGLPVPWHYRAPRDTRTAFDMAGIDDHSAWLDQHPGPLGVPHHALDDAICQARAVCSAYGRLRDLIANPAVEMRTK